ncbi:MAG: hypothetical protein ABW041_01425 [Dehalococcoides mccartyi]|nr:hypothetical protein DMOBY_06380 [Dehalococcoides mccartyi]
MPLEVKQVIDKRQKWQDKPDKEGWWWQDVEAHLPRYKIIHVLGKFGEMRVKVLPDLPTLDDYLARYGVNDKVKFQYIPAPDHTKERNRDA